ncbi:hypothetical protein E4U32_001173 [Claviceps aff. humidiphila group G2b]|nr:hypothetical protein E4U32_001173 [Claviceps aff. humidiphila group G2b]
MQLQQVNKHIKIDISQSGLAAPRTSSVCVDTLRKIPDGADDGASLLPFIVLDFIEVLLPKDIASRALQRVYSIRQGPAQPLALFMGEFLSWCTRAGSLAPVGKSRIQTNKMALNFTILDAAATRGYASETDFDVYSKCPRTFRGAKRGEQLALAEVEAAWDFITDQLPHAISSQDVLRLGKDPNKTAKWPSEWGFGSDAYIAELDIVHTVHCLNAVHRDVHWRHYFGDRYPDGKFPELHRTHTDHCIYIILQNLMCNANGDIVTNVWVEGQLHPFPDFNVNKKCRKYGTFIDWHRKTQITDMKRFLEMRKPHGHVPWKMSQKFHDLFQTGLKGGSKEEILD